MTHGNWGEWIWIGTESEFLQFLADGYIGSISDIDESRGENEATINVRLTRGHRAVETFTMTVDTRLETGRPVAVRWRTSVIQPLLDRHGVSDTTDEIRINGCLPLSRDAFLLELESSARIRVLEAFDELGWVKVRAIKHVGVFGGSPAQAQSRDSVSAVQLSLDLSNASSTQLDESIGNDESDEEGLRHRDPQRESRLQCAIELCAAIPSGWSDLVRRMVVAEEPEPSDPEIIRDLLSTRSELETLSRSCIRVAAEHLLGRDPRWRFGPLPIAEKSDFLEVVRRSTESGSPRRMWVDELLHRVRSDEPIGSMDVGALDVDLQAVVLFLLFGDSPSRIVELDTDYVSEQFGVTDRLAHLAAAFFTGLRFVRSMLPADRSFPALRDVHVRHLASMVNGLRFDLVKSAQAEVVDGMLVVGGETIIPRSSAYAITFLGPVDALCLHDGGKRRVIFDRLVVRHPADLVSYKSAKTIRLKSGSAEAGLALLRFREIKNDVKVEVVDQQAFKALCDEAAEGELRFGATLWLFNGESSVVIEQSSLLVAEADLIGALMRSRRDRGGGRLGESGNRGSTKVTLKALRNAMTEVRLRLPRPESVSSLPL